MRFYGFALAGVLLGQAAAAAQQPTQQPTFQPTQQPTFQPAQQPPPVTLDPARNPLDALLVRWEQEIAKVQTFSAQCSQTVEDKTFQSTDVFLGTVKYMKPGLAKLEMRKKDNPEIEQKYIFTGTYLYQCLSQQKKVYYQPLPPPRPGAAADDNFLSLLFGTKAEEIKRRYALKLDPPPDAHYYYIDITPRYAPDRADFVHAQLVLLRDSFLPRRLWLEKPNKNTELWDIGRIDTNVPLGRAEFQKPDVPPGWKLEEAPRLDAQPPPPRVFRPAQP